MKKALLFLSILIAFKGFTQTYVSGNIKGNTTWTKANSPYILTGIVGVPAAYTLTIEPGVTVEKTAVGQGIIINGALQCNGTETDSIIFITDAPPNIGDNYFLKFQKANLSNSGLRFITFHNGDPNALDIAVGDENVYNQTNPTNTGTLLVSRSAFNHGYSMAGGYNAGRSFSSGQLQYLRWCNSFI